MTVEIYRGERGRGAGEGPRGAEPSTLYGGLFYSLYHQQIARERGPEIEEPRRRRRQHAALARDTPDSIKNVGFRDSPAGIPSFALPQK